MTSTQKKNRWAHLKRDLYRDRWLYLFLFVPILFFLVFRYGPMFGIIIAFQDFRIGLGFADSQWVGLANFQRLFRSPNFIVILRNTLLLNIYGVVVGFPIPIILAIMLNEVRNAHFKRISQSVLYLPFFISWVVLAGIFIQMLSPSTGVVNAVLSSLGIRPIFFMASTFWWPIMFIISGIWAGAGWGTIIYLAAISNIDQEQYEAARIDGANRFRQIWHVTLPGIKSTIAIMLILRMGSMMDVGFDHIFNMQNPAVLGVADVISTYVFRVGILGAQFSYTTAIGLFQSVVSLILIVSVNAIVRKMGENSLW